MPTIREIASTTGFTGTPYSKSAEVQRKTDLPAIDNGDPVNKRANISTSIDCYVAGEYLGRRGQRIQVTQRYTIFVRYNQQTQLSTMQEVRSRIMSDFQIRFAQFNATTVFVPDLLTPSLTNQIPELAPEMMYRGSEEWRLRIARASFDIGTEREKATRNITNIRRRYDL